MGERSERTTRVSRASKELHLALRDAREQSAASREILAALGRAGANPGEILDTVLEHAARLCRAQAAQLYLLRRRRVSPLASLRRDPRRSTASYLLDHPIARNRSSTVGRAAEERRTIQIPTCSNDADYGRHDLQRLAGFRTLLSTPMILQDEVVGVLSMWRTDVAPFNTRECELLEEFAVQGAIVMRQVALMRALETRGTSWRTRSRNWRRCGRSARRSARASTSTRSWTRSSATPCGSLGDINRRRIDHGVRRVDRFVPRPRSCRQQP